MSPTQWFKDAQLALGYDLFKLGDNEITLATVVTMFATIAAGVWGSRLLRRAIRRGFQLRGVDDAGTTLMVERLAHYAVMAIALMSSLQMVGIDLDALLAAGAVFAVGFGLAMQSIAQNFVSGVILLVERSIRPGDIIELGGQMVQVEMLTVRNTVVRTPDADQLIVPNSLLAQATVRNFTKHDTDYRLRVQVGVTYNANVPTVIAVLEDVGRSMSWAKKDQSPLVTLQEFADSALVFELSVWSDEPMKSPLQKSEMRIGIWSALKEAGIEISYPQLDVHLDMLKTDKVPELPLS